MFLRLEASIATTEHRREQYYFQYVEESISSPLKKFCVISPFLLQQCSGSTITVKLNVMLWSSSILFTWVFKGALVFSSNSKFFRHTIMGVTKILITNILINNTFVFIHRDYSLSLNMLHLLQLKIKTYLRWRKWPNVINDLCLLEVQLFTLTVC